MALRPLPILWPLSLCYGAIMSARNRLYDAGTLTSHRPPLPVICIGNVAAGGSGKTPFVIHLASELSARGQKPAIVSRGYGGSIAGPHVVTDSDSPAAVGDEPVLLHVLLPQVPVVIGSDRLAAVELIANRALGEIVLLDDGYQHRRLARTKNLLLLDCSTPASVARWSSGKLLPAGYLREHIDDALRRADAVIFTSKGQGVEPPTNIVPRNVPSFRFTFFADTLRDLSTGKQASLESLRGTRVVATAAIADPEQFFEMLRALGAEIHAAFPFDDHCRLSNRDWQKLRAHGLPVVCTEKDAVKLRAFVHSEGEAISVGLRSGFTSEAEKSAFWGLLCGV